ncbi:MAG TPA: hypothetical protein PKA33_07340 [Amaricoccus sp.]|uniref:ketopantoate reductase family protein n=1 Tax=Amaricoccus sp. TaxID=1872485 RepID=UPI002CC53A17|nr:hypothetical protein [Amaricoccus sp.]HMQ92703.1 hypothetical protein [Amaricoccus sp.]HMR51778.1 hypothetical protein [Amaricoccus sp.]HMR61206.1 hypothetical protein [Amaricoccus sp.]HMT99168.1 hypothetical protein [Amaricoccus sp.]
MKMLILGASYGSLLSTKLLMAGHDATLVCRAPTAELINSEGTILRMALRDGAGLREIRSAGQPGRLDAVTPEAARPEEYDLVGLAMQEPQYSAPAVRELVARVAASGRPCLSIMNMPPPPYLRRIPGLPVADLDGCYNDASVWEGFPPDAVTLCSPDPQAFRPPDEPKNLLQVGLATNFKAAVFADPRHTALLRRLEDDILAVRLDGEDVPVKLRVFESLFVPMAKWSMLLTGNYRCILPDGVRSIRDAVLGDPEVSRGVYDWVDALARRLGAEAADQVPFEKYAAAAQALVRPSSAARAIAGGATAIERVDRLVRQIGARLDLRNATVDEVVRTVDARLEANRKVQA